MSADTLEQDAATVGYMQPKQIFQFYFLLPAGLGLFLGAGAIGPHQFVTIGHHIAYATVSLILAWVCYGLGSKLAAVVLRPWHPSLWVVLIAGYFGGGFGLLSPLRELLTVGFEPFLQPGSVFRPFWPPPRDNLDSYIVMTVQTGAGWLLLNWLDFRYRRVPRFGFVPQLKSSLPEQSDAETMDVHQDSRDSATGESRPAADLASDSDATISPDEATVSDPRLRLRLPDELSDAEIYALEAEEHYTKIHTNKGNTLILMRFSDAIDEMQPQTGLRVHRSYWISRNHVKCLARVRKRLVIQMPGDLEIPLSRSYRVLVESAGFDQDPVACNANGKTSHHLIRR